jgi:hypothetical protein
MDLRLIAIREEPAPLLVDFVLRAVCQPDRGEEPRHSSS